MPPVIRHPDVRRGEMLDRALALFLQRGCDNVCLNDAIADAGVSKGAFYHWFPSKDALIAALVQRSAHDGVAAVEDVLTACGGSALDRLNALLHAGFNFKVKMGSPSSSRRWSGCSAATMRTCTDEASSLMASNKASPA
jgi:TetR/AcrR family transcriptional regulator, cholesterol catabolism regulator